MENYMKRIWQIGCLIGFVALIAGPVSAKEKPKDLEVQWGKDYETLSFNYLGEKTEYPKDLVKAKFPAIGKKLEIKFEEKWPVVAMRARWSISAKDWPNEYRPEAIDLILMYACSASLYEYIYPKYIKSSKVTMPPEFKKDAADRQYRLAEVMRGKELGYEVTAKGGFGAADYKIKTKIRIGLSKDGKSVFYFDEPSYISDYLESREFLFGGHDAGDTMHFEIVMMSICKTPQMFKGEITRRTKETGQYFVERLYEDLSDAPTKGEIEKYLNFILKGEGTLKEVLNS
jgi:hypothetical protein